jgi:glycerophosphoryl diester phosphodiesterase
MLKIDDKKFYTIGHRGMEVDAVENTLDAFTKTIDLGLDFIELDVQKTQDGEIIIFHDHYLNKKTSLKGKVNQFTLNELKSTYVSTNDRKDKICTLNELIELVLKRKSSINLIIELKASNIEKDVIECIKRYGLENRVIIDSFNIQYVVNCQKLNSDLWYSWLIKPIPSWFLKFKIISIVHRLKKLQITTLSLNRKNITPKIVKYLRKRGFIIFGWGIKKPSDYHILLNSDINGFTAPDPKKLLELLKK